VLKGLGRLFSSADLDVKTFDDPRSLRYAQTHRPTVALIDVCMPIMSGLEVNRGLVDLAFDARYHLYWKGRSAGSFYRFKRRSFGLPDQTF
jgi:DNA-binding NarL/FixJ family response regulator